MPASILHHRDIPKNIFTLLSKAVGLFLLIACFFILQRIFDLDVFCTCRPGPHLSDFLFITAPPLVLTWIVSLTESFYQRSIVPSCCNHCCSNFCSSIVTFLIKYLYLTAVWASTVLLDGDWYFCLVTNCRNNSQTGLPCREKLTYEEELIRAQYRNESIDWGFGVICGILLLWNLCECLSILHQKDNMERELEVIM